MRKIITTFLVLILLFPTVFAEECKIKSGPAPALEEYISNLKSVVSNISSVGGGNSGNKSTGFMSGVKVATQRIFNTAFNWDGYNTSFNYSAVFPVGNEVPKEVTRDYELLQKERENIVKQIKAITNSGKDKEVVANPCSGVSGYCDIPDNAGAGDLLAYVLKNHDNIESLFRSTVDGDFVVLGSYVTLVPQNFVMELEDYYSQRAYGECSKEEGEYYDRVSESIEKTGENLKDGKQGAFNWKQAWAKLFGGEAPEKQKEQEEEKYEVFKQYEDQQIYAETQLIREEVGAKYNQYMILEPDGTFLYAKTLYNNAQNQAREDTKDYRYDKLIDYLEKQSDGVPIGQVLEAQNRSIVTNLELFNNIHLPYTLDMNLSADNEYKAKIEAAGNIKTYVDATQAVKQLSESCEMILKACKEQDKGNHDCGKCIG